MLLLRVAVGGTGIIVGLLPLADRASPAIGLIIVSLIAIACGVLLLVGFFTPAAAVIVGLGSAGLTLPGCPALTTGLFDAKPSTGFVIVMAMAILLLGPGAFSLDSYLFGRREIVIPPSN